MQSDYCVTTKLHGLTKWYIKNVSKIIWPFGILTEHPCYQLTKYLVINANQPYTESYGLVLSFMVSMVPFGSCLHLPPLAPHYCDHAFRWKFWLISFEISVILKLKDTFLEGRLGNMLNVYLSLELLEQLMARRVCNTSTAHDLVSCEEAFWVWSCEMYNNSHSRWKLVFVLHGRISFGLNWNKIISSSFPLKRKELTDFISAQCIRDELVRLSAVQRTDAAVTVVTS
jgi:hypothetical protein